MNMADIKKSIFFLFSLFQNFVTQIFMKFRFCGDGDCPDWVLAEIHSTLSILSSIKLRILAQLVAKSILGDEIPEGKIKDIFANVKTDLGTAKSATSCLRFLLTSAARHNADESIFGEELQQLGLPKEHSSVLCRILAEYIKSIRQKLLETCLTVNELEDVSYKIAENSIDCAELTVKIKNEIIDGVPTQSTHVLNIHKIDTSTLLKELKAIKDIFDKYDYDKKYNEE